jgi:cytochrome bd-type quinol oxidase subunit 2
VLISSVFQGTKIRIDRFFREFFSSFAIALQLGFAFILMSIPAFFLMTGTADGIFREGLQDLRRVIVIAGCGAFLLGSILIFWGIRLNAVVGSWTYRITHPRIRR